MCGDEVLSIAAMITIQVSMCQLIWLLVTDIFAQDVFVIPDGAPGALAELERRKFTAEEGVSTLEGLFPRPRNAYDSRIYQDHLTLLNGTPTASLMGGCEAHFP